MTTVVRHNVLVSALWTENLSRPKFPFDKMEVDALINFVIETGEDTARTSFYGIMQDEDDRMFYEISLTPHG